LCPQAHPRGLLLVTSHEGALQLEDAAHSPLLQHPEEQSPLDVHMQFSGLLVETEHALG
jgi:hypothetical protein